MLKNTHGIKLIKSVVLTLLFIAVFSYFDESLIYHPQIWLMVVITVVASLFQPDYSPFRLAQDDKDKGTALQIIWCVYLSQALILSEFVAGNPSQLGWNAISLAGAATAVIGLVVRSWAYLELGSFFTWHISVMERQPVIDTGPYRWLAHPGYSGALLTYTATGIMLQAWLAAALSFVILFFAFKRRINFEEQLMLQDLGEPYRTFLDTRAKLLPFVY